MKKRLLILFVICYSVCFSYGIDKNQIIEQCILESVTEAYNMECLLWRSDNKRRMKSYEDVYLYFNKRWFSVIASNLANYNWNNENEELRATEATLAQPEFIEVLLITNRQAIVYLIENKNIREYWGLMKYSILKIENMTNNWVIINVASTDKKPTLRNLKYIRWRYK